MVSYLHLDSIPTVTAVGIPRHGEAQSFDSYLLPEHWCFHIYGYQAVLELNGTRHAIHPGDATVVPPGVRMVYRYSGPSEHVYFHFKPEATGKAQEVPMILPLGTSYEWMDRRARSAIIRARTDPAFVTATLWSLLWETADLWSGQMGSQSSRYHPIVTMAIQHIEQRLSSALSVSLLCREVGVSYGYLTRLFRNELGTSVSEYVRSRRAEQATHLLTSTNIPIKSIARSIGVPRLSQFNRLMHEQKGSGPRKLRASAQQSTVILSQLHP